MDAVHMEISASAVRCGAPVGPPAGLNLGQMTADPLKVTCPACKPRKYWQDPPAPTGPVGAAVPRGAVA